MFAPDAPEDASLLALALFFESSDEEKSSAPLEPPFDPALPRDSRRRTR